MENKISIVYICDEYYVMPTCVSIQSIYENKKNSIYNIYILGIDISERSKQLIESIELKDINIKLFTLENKYKNVNTTHVYVSKSALHKFDIPNILPDLDKVLYLDSDTIVQSDLAYLFNTDINDLYAGVVKDFSATYVNNDNERLGLKNYFNSGVMLLNLKNLRQENIPEKLLHYKLHSNCTKYMDQDCFNAIFEENVIFLNPKYNYLIASENLYKNEAYENIFPEIVHFAYLHPWKHKSVKYCEIWKRYLKNSVCKNYKLECDRPLFYTEKKNNKRIIYIGKIKITF